MGDESVKRFNQYQAEQAESKILAAMIGIHFTLEQAENIKAYLDAHTEVPSGS